MILKYVFLKLMKKATACGKILAALDTLMYTGRSVKFFSWTDLSASVI